MQSVIYTLNETALVTAELMKTILPSLYFGLFLANLCAAAGLADRGRRLIPAIVRITGLSAASAMSVLLSIGDRTAGMAVLAAAHERASLTDREIIAANLTAKLPSVLQFFLFSFIPIMISLFPGDIAARFLMVYFGAFAVISAFGVLGARIMVQKQEVAAVAAAARVPVPFALAIGTAICRSWRPFATTALWMAGLSFAAMLFIKTGLLSNLARFLPLEAYSVDANILPSIGAGLVSMLGGIAALGGAFREGAIPPDMIVPLLLTISLLHNCYDFFASSIPRTAAIFGRRLGLRVAIWSFGVTQAVVLTAILLTLNGWL